MEMIIIAWIGIPFWKIKGISQSLTFFLYIWWWKRNKKQNTKYKREYNLLLLTNLRLLLLLLVFVLSHFQVFCADHLSAHTFLLLHDSSFYYVLIIIIVILHHSNSHSLRCHAKSNQRVIANNNIWLFNYLINLINDCTFLCINFCGLWHQFFVVFLI